MSNKQIYESGTNLVAPITLSQDNLVRVGHQYSTTSLDGNSSAHFGDVYHQYYSEYAARGQSRTPLRPSSFIPFRRDRDFVERDTLQETLQRTSEPAARIGLAGLGGVGKTQIAIEYAYRRQEADPQIWVFWIHASNIARFEESYRQIAQHVHINSWADPKVDVLSMVYAWLSDENNGRWTLVVDNADSSDVMFESRSGEARTSTNSLTSPKGAASSDRSLSGYLPSSAHGSIVITSRSREVVEGMIEYAEDILDVRPMTEEEGAALLCKKLKGPQLDVSGDQLLRLVQELDCMPLAITQAAAYINQMGPRATVSQYLDRLTKDDLDRDRLLRKDIRDPRRDGRASNSIIITWHTSFEYIRQTRGSAAQLLALMSLFDREGIPETLLQGKYICEEEERSSQREAVIHAQDKYGFEDDLAILRAYSLVSSGTNDQLFDMHRLVQFSTRKWLELHGELALWQGRYLSILDAAFPTGDYANWLTCQELFPHVEAMVSYSMASDECLQKRAATLCRGAWYARENGRYGVASQMAGLSLIDRERLLGRSATQTIQSVHMLASVLRDQGKYEQAEEMNRRALVGYEKELGPSHPHTLTSVSNLALVLQSQGKYEQAEEMSRRALVGSEKELGPSHPDTLTSVSNLASVLQSQGKYEQAEEMSRRALVGREKELGPSHPDTLTSVYCLADLLHAQRDCREALRLYDCAVKGYIEVLGASHPITLACQAHRRSLLQDMNLPSVE